MALETFDIEFRAKLDDFKRELDTIPGITKKAARELTREFTQSVKQARREQLKAADASKDFGKQLDALEKLSSAFGGTAGQLTGGLKNLTEAFSGGAGAMVGLGAAMIAGAAAVYGVVSAVQAVATAVIATADDLDELREKIDAVDRARLSQAMDQIETFGGAVDDLRGEFAELQIEIVGNLAPALLEITDIMRGVTEQARKMSSAFEITSIVDALTDAVGGLVNVSVQLVPGLGNINRMLGLMGLSAGDAVDVGLDALAEGLRQSGAAAREAEEAGERQAETTRSMGRAAAEAAPKIRELSEAQKAIAAILSAEAAADAAAVNRQLEQQADAVRNLARTYEDLGAAVDGMMAVTSANVASVGATTRSEATAAAQTILGTASQAMGAIGSLVGAVFERQISAAREGSAEQRKILRRQFAAQKAVAISQASLNAALASLQAFATTPGGPVAQGIAAGIAGAIGAGMVAAVAATPAPKLHTGGMVSRIGEAPEVPRVLLPGEAVLNRQAVQDVGGPSGVNRMNTRQGGTGGGMVVVTMLSGRVLDAVVESDLSRPGSALGSAVRAGRMAGRRRTALGV